MKKGETKGIKGKRGDDKRGKYEEILAFKINLWLCALMFVADFLL